MNRDHSLFWLVLFSGTAQRAFRSVIVPVMVFLAVGFSGANGAGLNWDERDLEIWRERSVSGPYRSAGDAYDPRLPGEWQRIASEAAAFSANPAAERKSGIVMDSGPTGGEGIIYNHVPLLSAAFYALVKEDAAMKRQVVDELVWHANQSGLQIAPDRYIKTDDGNWWQAGWFARLVVAADFVKDEFTSNERAQFNAWVHDWARAYESSVDYELSRWLFTGRADRNYSDGGPYFDTPSPDAYAYMDASGKKHNMIDRAHKHYNNRKASVMQFVGLYAAFSGDSFLIDRSKLYFEEWLKFSVFPDGSSGEFERNNDSGRNIQQGFLYNARNIEAYVTTADALSRLGDHSLYELSTGAGIHGSASKTGQPKKSLRMVIETHFDLMHAKKAWYNADRAVDERYRIDHVANIDGANPAGTQWVNELWFAPIANRYWKDADILQGYTRTAPESVPYAQKIGTAGPFGPPWRGHQAVYPSIPFMFAQTEALLDDGGSTGGDDGTTGGDDGTTGGDDGTTGGDDDTTVTPEPAYDLVYALTYDSPDFLAFEGATIDEPVYVAVKPDSGILQVDYYLKTESGESFVNMEKGAPFDYIYAYSAIDPADIGTSGYTIVAVVKQSDGEVVRLESTAFPKNEITEDRLPDTWEEHYFGGLDVVNGGEADDFDGDLVTNYDEWVAGTDPTDPEDHLSLEPVLGVSWRSRQDRSYRIEYTDDNWNSSDASDPLPGNGEVMVWVDPAVRDVRHNRQYRILVVNN